MHTIRIGERSVYDISKTRVSYLVVESLLEAAPAKR